MQVLHDVFPDDAIAHPLPGTRPMQAGDWLRRDACFAEQMALRDTLIAKNRDAVIAMRAPAAEAIEELLGCVCRELGISGNQYDRPDGQPIPIDTADPLATLGRLCQEDFAIMLRGDTEHWLAAGVICFPSRWTLAQKIGRPLIRIHQPVTSYDDTLARRVQRLFDGVQIDKPLVRWNRLPYVTSALFNPLPEGTAHPDLAKPPYLRMERQVMLRLPHTRAVCFSIHTYLMAYNHR